MEEMKKEEQLEQHIEDSSEAIAHELITKRRTRSIIDDKNFTLAYYPYQDPKTGEPTMSVLAVDEFHFKISSGNYRPFKIEAVMDKDYSEEENLQVLIEGFIRHISGLIKPEEIEE